MPKTIMIIDDDIHIGNMLEETLKLEGYEVLRAYSGTEASSLKSTFSGFRFSHIYVILGLELLYDNLEV